MPLFCRDRPSVKLPLQGVLVIPFVLQVVVAVGLVGYLSYRSGQRAIADLAQQLMTEVSERVSDRLDHYLQVPQALVRENQLAVEQGMLNLEDLEQVRRQLRLQVSTDPAIGSSVFWNPQGESIGYGRVASPEEQTLLQQLSQENLPSGTMILQKIDPPGERQHYLVDLEGKPRKLIYTLQNDFRQLPWYRQAQAAGKQTWTPIFFYRVPPLMGMLAIAPIYDARGQFQGVFSSSMPLTRLSQFLSQLKFSPSGQIFILERSGELVATSTLETPYLPPSQGEPLRLQMQQSRDTGTREIAQQLLQQFGSLDKLDQSQQLDLEVEHQRHFARITPHRDEYGLEWLIVTVVPESDFTAAIETNTRKSLLLGLVALAGAIASGILTAGWITRPIRRLSLASQALATGTWHAALAEDSAIAELSTLSQFFNHTAEQLQQSWTQIKTALEESEEKFKTIFLASPDPISISTFDHQGQYLEVNDSFLKFCEYSREEVIGHSEAELRLSANPQQNILFLQQLKTQGAIQGFEFQYRTKSGRLGTALLSLELIELNGKTLVLTIGKEISDRKQLEQELEQSRAQLESVLDSSLAAINTARITKDHTWKFEYLSAGHQRLLGFSPEELKANENLWYSRVHPEDLQQVILPQFENILAGKPTCYEYRFQHRDGSWRWIFANLTSHWNSSTQTWQVTSVAADITPRKQAEAALDAEYEFRQTLEAAIVEGIATVDMEGRQTYVNPAFCRMVGWSAEELLGAKPPFVYWPPEEIPHITQALELCLQNQRPANGLELRFMRRNGERFDVLLLDAPLQDANGETIAWLASVYDITLRKRTEEQLRQSEASLQEAQRLAQVGSWELDLATGISCWTDELFRIVGWNLNLPEATYPDLLELTHPEDLPRWAQALEQAIDQGTPYEVEHRIIRPDGSIRHLVSKGQVVRDSQQRVVRLYGTAQDISDRKQVETELRQSKYFIEQLANNSPQILYLFDPTTGSDLYINRQSINILGYTPSEILEAGIQFFLDKLHPDDLPLLERNLNFWLTASDADVLTTESRFRHKDGSWRWLLSREVVFARNEKQQVVKVLGASLDITERKAFETALQESEIKFATIFQASPEPAWIATLAEGRFLNVNDSLGKLLGAAPEAMIGQTCVEVGIWQNLEDQQRFREILLANRRVQDFEVVFLTQEKTARTVLISARVICLEGQDCVIGVIKDITDRKRAEAALQASQAQLELFFSQSLDGFFFMMLDQPVRWDQTIDKEAGLDYVLAHQRMTKVNDAMLEQYKFSREEFIGLTPRELFAHDPAQGRDLWRRLLDQGRLHVITNERRADGTPIWIEGDYLCLYDDQGRITGHFGVQRDVSDRHKLDQMKDEFISIVSHELRTPLAAIHGSLGILNSNVLDQEPETAKRMLRVALNNSDRLVRLVNDILNLERLASGKVKVVLEPCEASDLMQQAVESVQAIAAQAAITLNLKLPSIQIWADPSAIIQTLTNLLSNAIKFSPAGSTVWLSAEEAEAPPLPDARQPGTPSAQTQGNPPELFASLPVPQIRFCVQDQGRGIPADKLETIFERFQQVDVSDARQKGGTGLGLAICKSIVQQHGGQIWAESQSGQGSIFYFTLPLLEKHDDQTAADC